MQTLKTRTVAILGAVLVGTTGFVTAAHADVPKMRVSYADLDVRSQDGQKRLAHRISRAADAVCAIDDHRDLSQMAAAAACRDKAVDHAYADLAQRGVTLR
jgi:UrcA family protein